MTNILEKVTGDLGEKKRWRELQKRAKELPGDYRTAYEEIRKYLWTTSGLETIGPFAELLDLFEEGAANGRKVLDITGGDVAAFADELARGEKGYFERNREKLNRGLAQKLGKTGE